MVPKLACYDILGAVSFLKPQPNLFLWRFSFHIINKCSTCAPKEALDIFHNFYTISRLLWKRQNICQGQWSQTLIQSRWVLPPGINTVFCNTCNHYSSWKPEIPVFCASPVEVGEEIRIFTSLAGELRLSRPDPSPLSSASPGVVTWTEVSWASQPSLANHSSSSDALDHDVGRTNVKNTNVKG